VRACDCTTRNARAELLHFTFVTFVLGRFGERIPDGVVLHELLQPRGTMVPWYLKGLLVEHYIEEGSRVTFFDKKSWLDDDPPRTQGP